MKTAQESFWEGEFGNQYSERCVGNVKSNAALFHRIMEATELGSVHTVLEFGANIGENLQALRLVYSDLHLSGVEINAQAADKLETVADQVFRESMLTFGSPAQWDMTFTKGVLIHIAPDNLEQAYTALYEQSRRYVLTCEYHNPVPVEIEYRGHSGKLWKRDFASELLDRYPDLQVVDTWFAWKRDTRYPQDDLFCVLMEKV